MLTGLPLSQSSDDLVQILIGAAVRCDPVTNLRIVYYRARKAECKTPEEGNSASQEEHVPWCEKLCLRSYERAVRREHARASRHRVIDVDGVCCCIRDEAGSTGIHDDSRQLPRARDRDHTGGVDIAIETCCIREHHYSIAVAVDDEQMILGIDESVEEHIVSEGGASDHT